ncbi:MAG: biopolymer transporter ExbD, partial [Victivallales bacterium]|jgi:biopolymer transport protein ExbD|nr:biopolymer transporter ExbD [Victivallales bacterium]
MLDIIFILLIHFMAATIFAQWENKLEIKVPTASSENHSYRQRGEVIINVDEKGVVSINSQELSMERLERILQEVQAAFQEQPVIIRADEKTQHKDVIKVLDLCAKVDIRNVSFATIRPEEK